MNNITECCCDNTDSMWNVLITVIVNLVVSFFALVEAMRWRINCGPSSSCSCKPKDAPQSPGSATAASPASANNIIIEPASSPPILPGAENHPVTVVVEQESCHHHHK
jgi:hypothetical protein